MNDVHGPTIVYSRDALVWQNDHLPHVRTKDTMDKLIGSLLKFAVPCLSITRVEWLDRITMELPIISNPAHLNTDDSQRVANTLASGRPVWVIGSPANGIAPEFHQTLGLTTENAAPDGIERHGKWCDGTEFTPGFYHLVGSAWRCVNSSPRRTLSAGSAFLVPRSSYRSLTWPTSVTR